MLTEHSQPLLQPASSEVAETSNNFGFEERNDSGTHSSSRPSYDIEKLPGTVSPVRDAPRLLKHYITRPLTALLIALSHVSLIFPRALKPAHDPKCRHLHPTAWLDALRGYASWIVVNHHAVHDDWRPGTSFLGGLPWFKFIFRGSVMVDVFFVISGYALSYRMLGFMHAKRPDRVMDSLASSTFRRYLRLYLPTATATFIAMLAYTSGVSIKLEDPPVLQPTWWANFQFWIKDTLEASDRFRHIQGWWYVGIYCTRYLPQMWTIPIEFRGSMILFLFCAATCKMTPRRRMALTWVTIVATLWWQSHYVGLFLAGMWIADLKLWNARQTNTSASTNPPPVPLVSQTFPATSTISSDGTAPDVPSDGPVVVPSPSTGTSYATVAANPSLIRHQLPHLLLFFTSFIFLTGPYYIDTNSSFPFNLVAYLIPPNYDPGAIMHFPMFPGCIMLVYSIDRSPLLQRPLMTPFSQWVGELSFGIYAMHQTVRWAVWERWLLKRQEEFWGPAAAGGFFQILPVYFVLMFLVIWAAELFRIIDVRVVRFGKVLQEWCFE